jgi:hypothetical protein
MRATLGLGLLGTVLTGATAGCAVEGPEAPVAGERFAGEAPPIYGEPRSPGGRPAFTRAERARCSRSRTSFRGGRFPPACWRPYSPDSPFNRPIPPLAPSAPRSEQIVDRLLEWGPIQHLEAGQGGTEGDWGHPVYFARRSDPLYRVSCVAHAGDCALEGRRVRIPARARPAGGEDAHLTVVEPDRKWQYDLYRVTAKPMRGGIVTVGWAGRTRVDGSGLGSDAVAARYGTIAGDLRAREIQAGRIDHALFLVVRCDSGRHVYPALKGGAACARNGEPAEGAPPMGTLLQLDMTDEEIEDLDVPDWKKTILRAMARYGMYVGDTGGSSWSLKEESGISYTSLGGPDPWVGLAREVGIPQDPDTGRYVFNLRNDVDWDERLRVVDPCVPRRTCGLGR